MYMYIMIGWHKNKTADPASQHYCSKVSNLFSIVCIEKIGAHHHPAEARMTLYIITVNKLGVAKGWRIIILLADQES